MRIGVNLKDIIVPEKFLRSQPNVYKIDNVQIDYDNGEDLGKEIVLNTAGELIDGYIRYLVLLSRGVERAEVTIDVNSKNRFKNKSTVYVYGKHFSNGKTYVWRMAKGTKHPENLAVGNHILVSTSRGLRRAKVERIEKLDKPPVDMVIRKVKECYGKPNK